MKKSMVSTLALAGLFSASLAGAAGVPQFVGEAGDSRAVDREITIQPDAKWVNVRNGETVKFKDVASGKSFVWHFDTPTWAVIDLAAVAPRGALGEAHLVAYVAQDPYTNDD